MLAVGSEIRYRIAALFEAHWAEFVRSTRQWIRPVVFETVRKIIACRTPALGCHLYTCPQCQRVEVVPHSCKSRFCPTCGKHATDRWAERVLNDLLEVPYHHLVVAVPAHLRGVLSFTGPEELRAGCVVVVESLEGARVRAPLRRQSSVELHRSFGWSLSTELGVGGISPACRHSN